MPEVLDDLVHRAALFKRSAIRVLSIRQPSELRAIQLDRVLKTIAGLSIVQDRLFVQSIMCVERNVPRAACVLAWAAFMDFLEHKIAEDGLVKLKATRPDWTKYACIEDLRENVPEQQIIEAASAMGFLSKSERKTILGLLAKRNECAHPSDYVSGLSLIVGEIGL